MDTLVYEQRRHTAHIRINRPTKNNALNLAVRKRLCEVWKEVESNPDIRSVILTGGQDVFSSGFDMVEVADLREKEPLTDVPFSGMETFGAGVTKPVIAAISGYCLGGGFLMVMVAADLRIASSTARFGMPEVKIGINPALGIPPLLARHFPQAIVMELLMTGNNITAEDAHRLGFVNQVVEPEDLQEAAEALAEKINELSPVVLRRVKEVVKTITAPDPRAVAFSNTISLLGRHTEDYLEGPRAFRAKRKPVWKGK